MVFKFIKPLTTAPEIKRKSYAKESLARQIIAEFETSTLKYAAVPYIGKVQKHYKTTGNAARAIGRAVKGLGLKDKIEVVSDEDNVYLTHL